MNTSNQRNINNIITAMSEHDLFKNLITGNPQSLGQLAGLHKRQQDNKCALKNIYLKLKE